MDQATTSNVMVETVETSTTKPEKKKRGFAAMDREKVREISSKGGKRAHELGVAHEFNSEEARRAGSLGGKATRKAKSV